jgi:hypothetical protein
MVHPWLTPADTTVVEPEATVVCGEGIHLREPPTAVDAHALDEQDGWARAADREAETATAMAEKG